jgi:hypothetical protein
LKAKEPKETKEQKKRETKPRKSKLALAEAAVESSPTTHIPVSKHAAESANGGESTNGGGSTNGTAAPILTITETVIMVGEPPVELIRERAYELFVERGYRHGFHVDDWLAAEHELKSKNRTA